jgi:hypothetical protein
MRLIVEFDRGFPYAQVFAPKGEAFVAIEPMGEAAWTEPGQRYAARFQVHVGESPDGDPRH